MEAVAIFRKNSLETDNSNSGEASVQASIVAFLL